MRIIRRILSILFLLLFIFGGLYLFVPKFRIWTNNVVSNVIKKEEANASLKYNIDYENKIIKVEMNNAESKNI